MTDGVRSAEVFVESSVGGAHTGPGILEAAAIEKHQHQSRAAMTWVLLALAASCVLVDFWMWPVFVLLKQGPPGISEVCFIALFGCTLAQGNLLAAWLAWSEGPFVRRLVQHWVTAAVLFSTWAVGVSLVAPPKEARMLCLVIGLAVPLVSLAAQLPPWVARQWFGWRITRAASGEELLQDRPLTIRGLMMATVLVGVSFALARLAPFHDSSKDTRAIWGVAFFIAATISTIGMLPAGRILLGMQRLGTALMWSGIYTAALTSLVWIGRELLIRYARNSGPPMIAFAMLSGLMVGYAATLIVAGITARAMGYRLARGRWRLIR